MMARMHACSALCAVAGWCGCRGHVQAAHRSQGCRLEGSRLLTREGWCTATAGSCACTSPCCCKHQADGHVSTDSAFDLQGMT